MTEIFKVNIGLSPELMNDVLKFIEEPYSGNEFAIQIILFKQQNMTYKENIWHRIFFEMNVKISSIACGR